MPAGHFDEGAREISVRTVGEFKDVEQVRNTIVATARDGSAVRLRDVAKVEDGFEEARTRVRDQRQEGVTLEVRKQSGSNTVDVSQAVQQKMAALTQGVSARSALRAHHRSGARSSSPRCTRSSSTSSSAAPWPSSSS